MTRNWLLHLKSGNRIITEDEAIREAKKQESEGVKPSYRHIDLTVPGWLVWSTYEDGAGVVYKRATDRKYIVVTGWQGDFCFA